MNIMTPSGIDSPIVSSLDKQCRALCKISSSDDNVCRFLAGSLSPNNNNQIYTFDYNDDDNILYDGSLNFEYGEIWHLAASDKYPDLFSAVVGDEQSFAIKLFRLPENHIKYDNAKNEKYGNIERVFDLVSTKNESLYENQITKQCLWHPDEGNQLLTCTNNIINVWDINKKQKVFDFPLLETLSSINRSDENKPVSNVAQLRWSSMFNCSIVAAGIGSEIYGVDTRISPNSPSSNCWLIKSLQASQILTIDFNPNSQYYLATGGDDCKSSFWDLRDTSKSVISYKTHSHWVWSIRYNPFHDQLVLSAGGDARVSLMRVQSIASDPINSELLDDDSNEDKQETNISSNESSNNSKQIEDKVINIYEDHNDSVYSVEWGSDPWIFASLGYESRFVINRVPKAEKYSALF